MPQTPTYDRAEARRRWAPHLSADQLWKCACVLHALATLVPTVEQRAAVNDRAERVEELAWDKALCHQIAHPDLP
jgi:hypothetical protein